MDKQRRQELVRAYKERRTPVGVFSVTCRATGEVWVGASRNLDGQENSLRFSLRQGTHRNTLLQAAALQHGETGIDYAVVEVLDDEALTPIGRADLLKAREAHWRQALEARRVFG